MSRYLLMLLTLFSIPNYLYSVCCKANLITDFVALDHAPGPMAFFNNGSGGSCLAVVNADGTLTSYTIDSSPSPCFLGINSTITPSAAPTNIAVFAAVSPNCVATTNGSEIIYYSFSGCSLSEAGHTTSPINATAMAFSPGGNCAISTNSSQSISIYSVSSCAISHKSDMSTIPFTPVNVAFSPHNCHGNTFFAILYSDTNHVDLFRIDNSTCAITSLGSIILAGVGGQSMTFSPVLCNDNILLAVDVEDHGVQLFTINQAFCIISDLGVTIPGTNYAFSTGYAFTSNGSCLVSNDQFIDSHTHIQTSVTNIYSIDQTTCTATITQQFNFHTTLSKGLAINSTGSCMAISFPSTNLGPTIGMYSLALNPSPVVSIAPAIQIICPNQPIKFIATPSGGTPPYTNYLWSGPNGFSEDTGANPTLIIPNPTTLNTGNYNVMVTDSSGCQGISSLAEVVVSSCA